MPFSLGNPHLESRAAFLSQTVLPEFMACVDRSVDAPVGATRAHVDATLEGQDGAAALPAMSPSHHMTSQHFQRCSSPNVSGLGRKYPRALVGLGASGHLPTSCYRGVTTAPMLH
ncbi:unnamed protein product [Urochloa humidicola]